MDDSAVSVSKGVFVYKNGFSHFKRSRSNSKVCGVENIYSQQLWFQSYKKLWNNVEKKLEDLNNDIFANLLSNLVLSIKNSYSNTVTEVPTAILLTGINMPDHSALFTSLSKEIKKAATPHIATLYSEDCQTLKNFIENTIYQLVNNTNDDEDSEFETTKKPIVKKPQCNFAFLQSWYESIYGCLGSGNSPNKYKTRLSRNTLVVVIPDFESFDEKVIQDYISVISSYLNVLPFVLVFGVATSLNAVHKSLPYHVSSKINVQIFNSQPSTTYLNNVIKNVFLTDDCPFHLGGNVFNLFTDIFLFYDLSVKEFIKNFKYAMLEHFSTGNFIALCTNGRHIKKVLDQLSENDLKAIRNLNSSKVYLKVKDERFKSILYEELQKFFPYLNMLHLFLKCLHMLVGDLPQAPLGKQVRELYCLAVSKNIYELTEYKECFKLLGFLSKNELCSKIEQLNEILEKELETCKLNRDVIEAFLEELGKHLDNIKTATTVSVEHEEIVDKLDECAISGKMNRKQLKEKLLELSKKNKKLLNKYEQERTEFLIFLQKTFEAHLQQPSSRAFHEIFFFDSMLIKKNIIGSHRADIHKALVDPHCYLDCNCCKLSDESRILSSMPDISILYKLHLEHGKLINLHDWLLSYITIVDPDTRNCDDSAKIIVKPELQARFTQGIADLEFLGFIKSSKRKPNHVMRLTWGG